MFFKKKVTYDEYIETVKLLRDRINSLVALQLATSSKRDLNKKIKFESIPHIGDTVFDEMVPEVENEDGDESKDYKAKVSIRELLDQVDP